METIDGLNLYLINIEGYSEPIALVHEGNEQSAIAWCRASLPGVSRATATAIGVNELPDGVLVRLGKTEYAGSYGNNPYIDLWKNQSVHELTPFHELVLRHELKNN
jgi:hypothetical protein